MNIAFEYVTLCMGIIAAALQSVKYLRVAQREHYIPLYTSRFFYRWQKSSPVNISLSVLIILCFIVSIFYYQLAIPAAIVVGLSPIGLSLKGRTSKLNWTRRLKTTALVGSLLLGLAVVAVAIFTNIRMTDRFVALFAFFVPLFIDGTLFLLLPLEKRLAKKYIDSAKRKLQKVNPLVVAITGSYGKTSTKTYLAHLLGDNYRVLASPKSFNNKIGLAKTINEGLVASTEIFLAEMGIFGPGELRDMCSWVVPKIAAITAVGPVHLERFRTVEKIARAKAEITERADTVVLNIDNPYLAELFVSLQDSGKKLISASAKDEKADVCIKEIFSDGENHWQKEHEIFPNVSALGNEDLISSQTSRKGRLALFAKGKHLASLGEDIRHKGIALTNIAVAAAIALELKCPLETIMARISDIPQAANRLNVERSSGNITVIDDTYNSNPDGAALAIATLAGLLSPPGGKKILVTPGMVELGPKQRSANEKLAYESAPHLTHMVIVNRTNRKALLAGIGDYQNEYHADIEISCHDTRESAVDFVKGIIGQGDAVLYENDLPDHYP